MAVERTLVVDLDGTLVQTDLLLETFWSALSRSWSAPLKAAGSLAEGRASLKQRLRQLADIDVASLPYNLQVVGYIRRWRKSGGRAALVTAADHVLAEKIARHLGIFDEVHGSDGARNLKGARKADFLQHRFGDRGFDYIGDAKADFPVWEKADKAVTVNLSRRVKARVDALGREAEHLVSRAPSAIPYLKALRPHQWLKNALVFVPMLAAHQFTPEALGQSLLAFIVFCFIASGTYVVNDLLDLSADRAHPRKRSRPFASGTIPIAHGTWIVLILLLFGLTLSLPLGGTFLLAMLTYCTATGAYSLFLKRQVVIDICVLAGLYTLRIVAGGMATDIFLSMWLLAFSIFFFLALAAIKRQAELVDGIATGTAQAHGRGYNVEDLPLVGTMTLAAGYVSVLVMALYVNSPDVLELYSYPPALWGICLVLLYWTTRIAMMTHRGLMHDDPIIYAVKDRVSQLCLLLIVACACLGTLL